METPRHHPPSTVNRTAMEDAGIGTTPTQVMTPRGLNLETPHNAYGRVEIAAGRVYLRGNQRTERAQVHSNAQVHADRPPSVPDHGGGSGPGEALPSMPTARVHDDPASEASSAPQRHFYDPVVRALQLPRAQQGPLQPQEILGRDELQVQATPGTPPSPASSSSSEPDFDLGHLEHPNPRLMCGSCGTRPAEDWLAYAECSECYSEH